MEWVVIHCPLLVQGASLISPCAAGGLNHVQHVENCMCMHNMMRMTQTGTASVFEKTFIALF